MGGHNLHIARQALRDALLTAATGHASGLARVEWGAAVARLEHAPATNNDGNDGGGDGGGDGGSGGLPPWLLADGEALFNNLAQEARATSTADEESRRVVVGSL